jgi:hypothetical protein
MRIVLLFLLGLACGPALCQNRPTLGRVVAGKPIDILIEMPAPAPDSCSVKVAFRRAPFDSVILKGGTAQRIAPRRYRYYVPGNQNSLKPADYVTDVLVEYPPTLGGNAWLLSYVVSVIANPLKGL